MATWKVIAEKIRNLITEKVSVLGDRASGNVHAATSLDPRYPGEYRRPSLALVYRRQRTETLSDQKMIKIILNHCL